MSELPVAAWLVTVAIIGCIALMALGALLCFPAPRRDAPPLRRRGPPPMPPPASVG